jgi:hypothetical protein
VDQEQFRLSLIFGVGGRTAIDPETRVNFREIQFSGRLMKTFPIRLLFCGTTHFQ